MGVVGVSVLAQWACRSLPVGGAPYCSPLPGGALAVSDVDAVRVYEADGRPRWTHGHPAWQLSYGAAGARAGAPNGRLLLAVTPPEAGAGAGPDVCVALDLATGEPLARATLPTKHGVYEFQHGQAAQDEVFLNAAQGQDPAYALLVSVRGDTVRHRAVGLIDEPFAGNSVTAEDFLTTAIDGEYLRRHRPGAAEPATVQAAAVLPDGLGFAGPGFLDPARVLTGAAPYPYDDAERHFVFPAPGSGPETAPILELCYPSPVDRPPLALGDGTWLTVKDNTVRRWAMGGPRRRTRRSGEHAGCGDQETSVEGRVRR